MTLLLFLFLALQSDADKPYIEKAEAFVDLLAAEKYKKAAGKFDATMKKALPPLQLMDAWKQTLEITGPYVKQMDSRTQDVGAYKTVFVTCEFRNMKFDVKVVFDGEKKIAGLFFVPTRLPDEYAEPPYGDRDAIREIEVEFGVEGWKLPGTLTVPVEGEAFAGLVLVHGSGPHDRDVTIGDNKPFKDLAWGLATRGIAVLRYEKRTKHYSKTIMGKLPELTVQEETVEDAVAAAKFLAGREEVDPKRVFLLGHSLGGMLAPRIGKAFPEAAGLIVLAGTARPLEDVILEQMEYIFSLDGRIGPKEEEELKKLEKKVAKVKKIKRGESGLIFGGPAAYWADLRDYHPAEAAAVLNLPMLILQGKRDYQVTMEDFALWQKHLGKRKDVEFKTYPKLNHLFIPGEGKITPREYDLFGNVSEEVIQDIEKWVKRQ